MIKPKVFVIVENDRTNPTEYTQRINVVWFGILAFDKVQPHIAKLGSNGPLRIIQRLDLRSARQKQPENR